MVDRKHLSRHAQWAGGESLASLLVAKELGQPNLISLAVGFVDHETLPIEPTRRALERIWSNPELARAALQYGTTFGYLPLREAVLSRMLAADGRAAAEENVGVEDVVVMPGSNQLLFLAADVLFDPGDIVLCAAPSYYVFLGALGNLGVRAVGVETDDQGPIPEAIEEELARRQAAGELERVKAIYLVSYFDNPRALTIPLERRAAIVEIAKRWSRRQRIYLIDDAAYRELRYEGDDVPSFRAFDPEGDTVLYAGTFSKSYSPGVRVGWGVLPKGLVEPVLAEKGNIDFGSPHLNQVLMATVMELGLYDGHVERLRAEYRRKIDATIAGRRRVSLADRGPPVGSADRRAVSVAEFARGHRRRIFRPVVRSCRGRGRALRAGRVLLSGGRPSQAEQSAAFEFRMSIARGASPWRGGFGPSRSPGARCLAREIRCYKTISCRICIRHTPCAVRILPHTACAEYYESRQVVVLQMLTEHPMRIIDRYLLAKFLQTFVICFLSLFGLFVLIELSTNLEKFIESGRNAGGVVPFIVHYYGYKTFLFFETTSGVLTLVSAMFTVSWIQKHNEMTALMAAGVSRIRILAPILIAVAVVTLLSAANREILIPRYRAELARRPQDPAGDKPQGLEDDRYDGRTNILLGGKQTFAAQKRISEPAFGLAQASASLREYGNQLTADNAYYVPPDGKHPGGYRFEGVHEPKNLATRSSLPHEGPRVLITPHDEPEWLKPDQCFLASDVDFDQLAAGSNIKQLSSTVELIQGMYNPSLNFHPDVRVEIHARLVRPFLDMTLLFLGLPLIVARENRNVFIAMGLCLGLTAAFTAVVIGSQFLGAMSFWIFTPSLSAWLPLMIFVPLAVGLADSLWR